MNPQLLLIQQAIETRRTISFNYEKEGRTKGVRIGNPHALFHDRQGKLYCDVYQTSGATDDYTLPDWRQFAADDMDYVQVLGATFEPDRGFNPASAKYDDAIAKIEYVRQP